MLGSLHFARTPFRWSRVVFFSLVCQRFTISFLKNPLTFDAFTALDGQLLLMRRWWKFLLISNLWQFLVQFQIVATQLVMFIADFEELVLFHEFHCRHYFCRLQSCRLNVAVLAMSAVTIAVIFLNVGTVATLGRDVLLFSGLFRGFRYLLPGTATLLELSTQCVGPTVNFIQHICLLYPDIRMFSAP